MNKFPYMSLKILQNCWEKGMKIKELRDLTGMSQSTFAAYFGISVRNIQEWEQERKQPPPYLVSLLKRILDNEYFNNGN